MPPRKAGRERAALAWTEALTLIMEGRAPDELYAEVRKECGEEELVNLSLATITINHSRSYGKYTAWALGNPRVLTDERG